MGEIIYEALAQYITIFFFVVMVLPAVVIFLGYLIYIVVMCIRELKKKSFPSVWKKHRRRTSCIGAFS